MDGVGLFNDLGVDVLLLLCGKVVARLDCFIELSAYSVSAIAVLRLSGHLLLLWKAEGSELSEHI